jgi:hypothetical protein
MAVDTRVKRLSMLNFGDGTNIHLLPDPDGTVDALDRATSLDLYAMILDPPVVPSLVPEVIGIVRFLNQVRSRPNWEP